MSEADVTPGCYKFAVYGYQHPMDNTELISRHRWQWTAALAAWWYRVSDDVNAHAWVREEDVTVNLNRRGS